MKAITEARKKFTSLGAEDLIELSCPDVIFEGLLHMPEQCDQLGTGTRKPKEGYSCRQCWNREV